MASTDFNEIYTELHPHIYRLAASIVGNREEAEDIAQDLYERLWHKRLLMGLQQNPRGYILAAARNLCLDRIRARKPKTELPATLASSVETDSEMVNLVAKLVAALPEKQRTAMHLRDIEGLEIDEIARIMHTRHEAVRMSLSRARNAVKEQLTKIINYGT